MVIIIDGSTSRPHDISGQHDFSLFVSIFISFFVLVCWLLVLTVVTFSFFLFPSCGVCRLVPLVLLFLSLFFFDFTHRQQQVRYSVPYLPYVFFLRWWLVIATLPTYVLHTRLYFTCKTSNLVRVQQQKAKKAKGQEKQTANTHDTENTSLRCWLIANQQLLSLFYKTRIAIVYRYIIWSCFNFQFWNVSGVNHVRVTTTLFYVLLLKIFLLLSCHPCMSNKLGLVS
jgi:hypothetical protein